MSAPEAKTPAMRALALWDLAEPMARLLLNMTPLEYLEGDRVDCSECGGPIQDINVEGPYPHAEGCPWAPGGLIERIRALVPEKEES